MSEKTMSTSPAAKGDDRNLVPVAPGTAASFEDRAYLFWKKYRNVVLGVALGILAAVLAFQVVRLLQARKEAEIGAAFAAATTAEAKRAFARAHPGHPLAGVALLAVADDSYAQARFGEAASEYAAALEMLEEPLLRGRARVGRGMALLASDQTGQGEEVLLALANDTKALMAFRTQAYYELAAHYAGRGDHAKARETIDRLKALDPEGYWANVASALRSRIDAEELAGAGENAAGEDAATEGEGDELPTFRLPGGSDTP